MIGFLKGTIKFAAETFIIVDVNGVGYKVEMSNMDVLEGQKIELFIHTHVREQELRLFGFQNREILNIFEKLLTISGVGPKVALNIVSTLNTEQILAAIQGENAHALKVPGVGLKTAQKIILELKNSDLFEKHVVYTGAKQNIVQEAVSALEGLGYMRAEIDKALSTCNVGEDWESEDVIKALLKNLRLKVSAKQ